MKARLLTYSYNFVTKQIIMHYLEVIYDYACMMKWMNAWMNENKSITFYLGWQVGIWVGIKGGGGGGGVGGGGYG